MRLLRLALILLLSLPVTNLFAAGKAHRIIHIPKEKQVENGGPGWCYWCSVETAANQVGCSRLKGIKELHSFELHGASFSEVWLELFKKRVDFSTSCAGSLSFVQKWTDRGKPVVVAMEAGTYLGGKTGHAITVVGVTDSYVYFVDSNNPGSLYRYETRDFLADWDGTAIVIIGD